VGIGDIFRSARFRAFLRALDVLYHSGKPDFKEHEAERRTGHQQADPLVVRVEVPAHPAPTPEQESRERNHEIRERWTLRVQWATFAAVVAYATINYRQLTEIHKQNEIAAAGLRPWLKVTSIDLSPGVGPLKTLMFHSLLTGIQTGPYLLYKVSVENVGHLVAQDVAPRADLFVAQIDGNGLYDKVATEEARFCDSVARDTSGGIKIVFPSDSFDVNGGVGGGPYPAQSDTAVFLIVCITYSGGPGTEYQTRALSRLSEKGDHAVISTGAEEDASDLRLDRDPTGDHAY